MSKVIKQMEMDDLKRTFTGVRDLVVLSTERLTSQGEYTFRAALRKKGVRLRVVKNSLCRRVFRELNLQVPDDSPYWLKQTMLAWGTNSISELTREIEGELKNPKTSGLYKDRDKAKVFLKGAIADGAPITIDQARSMPTREDLLAQIVSMIIGPGAQLAACLDGPGAQLASQLKTLSEKKEGEEAPAQAPAAT
jgi:ribosomal protein L10